MNRHSLMRIVTLTLLLVGCVATAHASGGQPEHGMTEKMMQLMLQLACILCAAKIAAFVCERYLKIPAVLGELGAGIIIGPYALGPLLGIFTVPVTGGQAFPISPELYGIATFASIILLYLAGLETDLSMFLRYSLAGTLVGLGGVIFSFAFGDLLAVWFGLADSFMDPRALFLGTISTATSVGITARILSERNKLVSPEGVTILAGAVIDDVLGIVILAVVVGMVKVSHAGGVVDWMGIGFIAAKALGFWLACTAVGLLIAPRIGKGLERFGSRQTMASLSLGLALLLAGLSEMAGLAMIIGAYIMGLSMSRVDCAHELRHRLEPVYETLVSVFFCVMGMMVNIPAMKSLLLFGAVYSLLAIVAKIIGCGLPVLFLRFNLLGAFRVGIGMLPRGEVALIVAGIGLASGAVTEDIFGVAIMMTLITTIIAPLIMVKIFNDKKGLRPGAGAEDGPQVEPVCMEMPNQNSASFLLQRILFTFEQEDCYVHRVSSIGDPIYQIRKEDRSIVVKRKGNQIILNCGELEREFAKAVLVESMVDIVTSFQDLGDLSAQQLRSQVLS